MVQFIVQIHRQRTEQTYQAEIRESTPIIGLAKSYIDFFLCSWHLFCIVYNQICRLNDSIKFTPTLLLSFRIRRIFESIGRKISRLIGTCRRSDIIALTLRNHRIGIALKFLHLTIKRINTHIEFVLIREERIGSQTTFRIFCQKVVTRSSEQDSSCK